MEEKAYITGDSRLDIDGECFEPGSDFTAASKLTTEKLQYFLDGGHVRELATDQAQEPPRGLKRFPKSEVQEAV